MSLFWTRGSGLLGRITDRLVADWGLAWRWFSVQAMALVVAIQGAWVALPDDLKARFPARAVTLVSVALLLLGIGGRLVKQRKD